ncbi:MAG: dihydrofolate reductase family protein [Chitinophagaceae bacterium]
MGKLIATINMTADGFCHHEDAIADEDLLEYYNDLVRQTDIVLFGKTTFKMFEEYWPAVAKNASGSNQEVEFAKLIDQVKKIVFTTTLQEVHWKNSSIISENIPEEVGKLKESNQDMFLIGSPGLISSFLNMGLIDEFRICVQPLLAGNNRHLFEMKNLQTRTKLQLVGTKHFDSGVLALHYNCNPDESED